MFAFPSPLGVLISYSKMKLVERKCRDGVSVSSRSSYFLFATAHFGCMVDCTVSVSSRSSYFLFVRILPLLAICTKMFPSPLGVLISYSIKKIFKKLLTNKFPSPLGVLISYSIRVPPIVQYSPLRFRLLSEFLFLILYFERRSING